MEYHHHYPISTMLSNVLFQTNSYVTSYRTATQTPKFYSSHSIIVKENQTCRIEFKENEWTIQYMFLPVSDRVNLWTIPIVDRKLRVCFSSLWEKINVRLRFVVQCTECTLTDCKLTAYIVFWLWLLSNNDDKFHFFDFIVYSQKNDSLLQCSQSCIRCICFPSHWTFAWTN